MARPIEIKGGPSSLMRALAKKDRLTLSRAAVSFGVRRTKLGEERSCVDPLAVDPGRCEIRWLMLVVLCPAFSSTNGPAFTLNSKTQDSATRSRMLCTTIR